MTPVQHLSDELLVARCRSGDSEAWAVLVERFSRYVYAICVRGFRLSQHDAEDVFQDVFARTHEQLGRLRDDAAIPPLDRPAHPPVLHRQAPQRTRGWSRSRRRASRTRPTRSPTSSAHSTSSRRSSALGEPCQEILDRFFARDESYRTIGAALDLPGGTIASRISRCLEKLKLVLEDPDAADRPVGG